jgi:predicted dienelactone hydrolase
VRNISPAAGLKNAMRSAFAVFLLAITAYAWQEVKHATIAGRDVAIWRPASPVPHNGYPLVVFSHGFGGCNTQSVFLMEALARAGYSVLAPNHKDARCGNARREGWYPGKLLKARRPPEPFREDQKWTDATYKDRATDVSAVLDSVLQDKSFAGILIDRDRVGIAGHSLGGYTALGVAGGWPAWKDKRIKAVLAMAAYCIPYVDHGDLPHVNVPVMYQGGTRDLGVTPTVRRFNGAYDLSSAPKYYVEFDGAGHLAWTDLNRTYQAMIENYSLAFFDHFLKNKTDPDPLAALTTNPPPKGVSYLKVASK